MLCADTAHARPRLQQKDHGQGQEGIHVLWKANCTAAHHVTFGPGSWEQAFNSTAQHGIAQHSSRKAKAARAAGLQAHAVSPGQPLAPDAVKECVIA